MAVALECRQLCFGYGSRQILERISFKIRTGTFCAVLGRNGSGKTTLLHCLNQVLKPRKGEVIIHSVPATALSRNDIARRISLVPQEHMDIFPFKVIDVVVMGRAPFIGVTRSPGPEDYRLAARALTSLNASDLAQKNFNRISGGERQIALLACALAQAADIMLLDEPTNHLDFNNQYHLLSNIKTLCRDRNLSVVASMHDPNMAMLFADEVIMIKNGQVIASGLTREVMTRDNISRLYDTPAARLPITGTQSVFLPQMMVQPEDTGTQ